MHFCMKHVLRSQPNTNKKDKNYSKIQNKNLTVTHKKRGKIEAGSSSTRWQHKVLKPSGKNFSIFFIL